MGIGDLIRYKHNGKMGVIIRIDNLRGVCNPGNEDTHLVLWSGSSERNKQKWFVSPGWIERVESD
jgi:hypothetical protein